MKPRITLVKLGVDDLERALRSYCEGLVFATQGILGGEFEQGAVVFSDLEGKLKLALWPRLSLARDTGMSVTPPGATGVTLGRNVSSKAEVDMVTAQTEKAGATIVKPARNTFWGGYAGYFQDPDKPLWEVAWNPQWPLSESRGGKDQS